MTETRPPLQVGGISIEFPVKPYPSQLAMMAQIVKGLRNEQNCLLESPTGSGKTLALLCSALGWQKSQASKIEQYNSLLGQGVTDGDILSRVMGGAPPTRGRVSESPPTSNTPAATSLQANEAEGGFLRTSSAEFDDDDDFQTTVDSMEMSGDFLGQALLEDELEHFRRKKVPKIFFGTRTHKQIKQIVKELQTTSYRNVKSLVLGSRDHTCIHPLVSKADNKNDECRLLREDREGPGCTFHHTITKYKTYEDVASRGLPSVFDLEDLVKMGRKAKVCPYYVSRNLMEEAQIIFCPYNYLIDPILRQNMSISLKDHVIVLDEAHNIEDSAREAASLTFTQTKLIDAKNELEKLSRLQYKVTSCDNLARLLSDVSAWVDCHQARLLENASEYNQSSIVYSGDEVITKLQDIGLGQHTMKKHLSDFMDVSEVDDPEDPDCVKTSSSLNQFFEKIFITLQYLYKTRDSINQYRMVLKRVQVFGQTKPSQRHGGWLQPRRSRTQEEVSVNLWCLNPGVAFQEIGRLTHSIVLTSGTLSPMTSFQSELGVDFPIQLEANHVITRDQVWVGTLSQGPTNKPLMANFRNTETYAFQDELGRLVLEVCRRVPRGILCFLPSYSVLDKITERWQMTGLWQELEKSKAIICEPKKGNELDKAMAVFYQALQDSKSSTDGMNGALFLAVCRGKVSEGLDFSDDNARAVIAVGIPFPNVKDLQVSLKRQYNDRHCKALGLLTGSQWYEIQAYRALNQALGRCIRHRHDWGALILVDQRYQQTDWNGHTKYTKGLSKWVRNLVTHHEDFPSALRQLEHFSDKMTAHPPSSRLVPSVCSPVVSTPKAMSSKRQKTRGVQNHFGQCGEISQISHGESSEPRFAQFPDPGKSIVISSDSDDDVANIKQFAQFCAQAPKVIDTPKAPPSTSVLLDEAQRVLAHFGDSDTEDFKMNVKSSQKISKPRKKMSIQFTCYESD